MRIIKIFGKLTDVFGTSDYQMSEEVHTVRDLKDAVERDFPILRTTTYFVIIGITKAEDHSIINDNDFIALLPPYSGG